MCCMTQTCDNTHEKKKKDLMEKKCDSTHEDALHIIQSYVTGSVCDVTHEYVLHGSVTCDSFYM